MPQWLLKLFQAAGRKEAVKRGKGITSIGHRMNAEAKAAEMFQTLVNAGLKPEDMAKYINSERDIIRLLNKVKSIQSQNLKNIERKFFDPSGKMKPEGEDIMKQGLEGLGKKDARVQQDVDGIIKNLKSMDPFDAIKEGRLIIGRKGKYKNLSFDESQKILKETDRHMLGQNLDDLPNPEDFASGGIARVGYFAGEIVKPKNWKLFKEFVEKLFIKSSNDIRLGKGKWAGLDQKQKMVQHDNLTTLVEQFQKTGKFDKKANEYFGIDAEKAFKSAQTKVKKVDLSKYTDKDLNALVDEDTKLLAEANKLSEAGTNYGRVQEIEARRKEIREIIEAAQAVPESGYGNIKADLALEKQVSKTKKDRLATADELEDAREILDPTGEAYIVEEGMTVKELDKMVADHKAYERYMYNQYKMGKLDPTPGDKSLARKRFLEQKLEDMELSGDKRLMTREEIEELSSFDLGTEMDEAIKKSKQKDIKQKRVLEEFDPTGRKKNASGGIAGELHLNQGGRARFQVGGIDPDYDIDSMRDPFQPLEDRGLQSRYLRDLGFGPDESPLLTLQNWLKINKDIQPWYELQGENRIKIDPYSKDFDLERDYFDKYGQIGRIMHNQLNIDYNPETGELARYVKDLPSLDPDKAPGGYQYFSGKRADPYELKNFNPVGGGYGDWGSSRMDFKTYGPGTPDVYQTAAPVTTQAAPTGIQTIPGEKKSFNVMMDEKGNVMKDQGIAELARETGIAPDIQNYPIRSMSDVQRMIGPGESVAEGTAYNPLVDPRMARSYQENIQLMGDPRMRPPMPMGGTPIDVMPPMSNEFTTNSDEQRLINELGIERYNQLYAKGGRVSLSKGGLAKILGV